MVTPDEQVHLLKVRESCRFYWWVGDYEAARKLLTEAIGETRDREVLLWMYVFLGTAFEKEGNFAGAVDTYQKALMYGPSDAFYWYFAHNNQAYSLVQLGRYEEAEFFCRKAIGLCPDRHNAYKNLGMALMRSTKREEAIEAFETATRLNPNDSRALVLLQSMLTG